MKKYAILDTNYNGNPMRIFIHNISAVLADGECSKIFTVGDDEPFHSTERYEQLMNKIRKAIDND